MMSTIAGSMMTVVGVTFSMVLMVLAMASGQYTSRILRNFIRSRITQVVLGIFAGIFTYCLIVLRTIRSGDEGSFVPNLAVSFGFVLAFGGVGALIFFIHHIASSIQASSIIALVGEETIGIFNRSYYEEVLTVRVHPKILDSQRLPHELPDAKTIRIDRYRSMVDSEEHLHRNGTRIIKFLLHLSKDEQRKRFLVCIDEPEKNWKFSFADVRERKSWSLYKQAYEECLSATSSAAAPRYIIPAEAQKYCVIAEGSFLGSMGAPIKLVMEGKPVFLCCNGCFKKAAANPAATLAKVDALKKAGMAEEHDADHVHAEQKK